MIRNRTLHSCVSNDKTISGGRSNRITSSENRFKIFIIAAFAPLCLLMFVPSAFAKSKTRHGSAKTETRTRRIADKRRVAASDKKRSSVKLAGKVDKRRTRDSAKRSEPRNRRETGNRHDNVKRREVATKRDSVYRREIAGTRERTNRTYVAPNVRKTVMISTPEANNRNVARPALVNDIVIISEAPATRNRLSTSARDNSANKDMPSIWPVAGAIRTGFGMRRNPFGLNSTEFHKGQDISAPYGAPVFATADGVVATACWHKGYGNAVYVDHGNGISTRYGHLSRIDVAEGQTIKRGDQLGLVGSTGRSTGPHLHYEVRLDGQATNPIPYLPDVPAQPVTTTPASQ